MRYDSLAILKVFCLKQTSIQWIAGWWSGNKIAYNAIRPTSCNIVSPNVRDFAPQLMQCKTIQATGLCQSLMGPKMLSLVALMRPSVYPSSHQVDRTFSMPSPPNRGWHPDTCMRWGRLSTTSAQLWSLADDVLRRPPTRWSFSKDIRAPGAKIPSTNVKHFTRTSSRRGKAQRWVATGSGSPAKPTSSNLVRAVSVLICPTALTAPCFSAKVPPRKWHSSECNAVPASSIKVEMAGASLHLLHESSGQRLFSSHIAGSLALTDMDVQMLQRQLIIHSLHDSSQSRLSRRSAAEHWQAEVWEPCLTVVRVVAGSRGGN